MLSFLPGFVLLVFSVAMVILNTALVSLLIGVLAILKLLLPIAAIRHRLTQACNGVMYGWLCGNALMLRLVNRVEWEVHDTTQLNPKGWHMVICNHQSWADIVLIGDIFRNRLPVPKFFLKHDLLYVPFVGLACWGLDMPFMRRYTRQQLLKNPALRGKDVTTAREACAKFKTIPTTVINFVEGSRFTPQKRAETKSPYQHLLTPKPAGLAMAINVLGEQFEKIVNVTLAYPDNQERPFHDMLSGRMKRIQVWIEEIPVTEVQRGDYMKDKPFKRGFQQWLSDVWQRKDQLLNER
ncbi:acyltransferase [Tolumonas lignilytica]|uniref:acyltransferase n=1 Tax=Tolumonas lignilytica TaxID=1283284 RepID=UPI0004BA028D|nr:acyltransferase [Tolumonas lignilytica]